MRKATSRFVQANGESPVGYGYTFWIQDGWEGVPRDTFMSRGHNLNHCYVVPSLDLVVARQGNEVNPREESARFVKTLIQKIAAAVTEET